LYLCRCKEATVKFFILTLKRKKNTSKFTFFYRNTVVYTQALLRYILQLPYGIHHSTTPIYTISTLKLCFRRIKQGFNLLKRSFNLVKQGFILVKQCFIFFTLSTGKKRVNQKNLKNLIGTKKSYNQLRL
jgi:hypothetical protein